MIKRLRGKHVKLSVFRTYHASHCQELANLTGEAVDLYRGEDGQPAVVLADWPCAGEYVGRFLVSAAEAAASA